MRVESITSWNESFFKDFLKFRNKIHQDITTSFPEELSDYSRYFAPTSPFAEDFSWEAFLIKKGEDVLAKAILCWRKGTTAGNLGFLDWENDSAAAELLIGEVITSAKNHSLKNIKTPVDLNFFVKYRIRIPGGREPFWGEPVYPDYYHELFAKTGFVEVGRWDTYQIRKWDGIKDYLFKRKKLSKKSDGAHDKTKDKNLKTTIRCVKMSEWDSELKIIYDLFSGAYSSMPEYEPISFEQFKVVYDDFKYILNPWLAYIVELRGKPVGFSINFADPLPVLAKVKGRKLNLFQKAILLAKLRLNQSCFLIAHVGKIPGPNGEEIKGVQIQVSKRIQFFITPMRKVLVTFQNVNSPSRRSFDPNLQDPYAQYVLYGLELK